MKRILFIFGTRPEAIKLCPVIQCMRQPAPLQVLVCVTAQHRAMLDQVLECFDVRPDFDLDLMPPGQTLSQITARALSALDPVLAAGIPIWPLCRAIPPRTLAGAMAAFYRHIPVAHVEAGLRTGDMSQPFPEEMNRVVTTAAGGAALSRPRRARLPICWPSASPTSASSSPETPASTRFCTVAKALEQGRMPTPFAGRARRSRKLIVVTAHRRESFGDGMEQICEALSELAGRHDIQIVYPVHRNPNVLDPVTRTGWAAAATSCSPSRSITSRSWI